MTEHFKERWFKSLERSKNAKPGTNIRFCLKKLAHGYSLLPDEVLGMQSDYNYLIALLKDAVTAFEWQLKLGFTCDCEPHNEYDTNATIHEDNCALHLGDHIEATLDMFKEMAANGD